MLDCSIDLVICQVLYICNRVPQKIWQIWLCGYAKKKQPSFHLKWSQVDHVQIHLLLYWIMTSPTMSESSVALHSGLGPVKCIYPSELFETAV